MYSISIVLPAYNEAENIKRCLDSIARAVGERDVDVTLVDNQSTDDTVEIARACGANVLQFPEKLTIAELRNRGGKNADADFILFIDSDMEVPENWLDKFDQVVQEARADVLGFVVDVPDAAPWYAKIWAMRTAARREGLRTADFLPGHNIAVKREYFDKVGGFSTDLRTSEDKDFVMRLKESGASVFSAPSIGIIHWGYEKTLGEWARKEFWRQSSHKDMLDRHGYSLRILRFPLISVFHLIALLAAIVALVTGQWGVSLAVLALAIVPSIVMTLMHRRSRASLSRAVQFAALYFARFNIAGAAVLFGARSGNKA